MKAEVFGYELILDCYDCDIKIISSKGKLKQYVDELCPLIKMKPYGETLIPFFGEKKKHTKGHSLVQLIETSAITGHFSEYWENAYINIFSCKKFNWEKAEQFTKDFFKVKMMKSHLIKR
jgi:S-adenosylmethionine/arginine decarboxylase-like enzyme